MHSTLVPLPGPSAELPGSTGGRERNEVYRGEERDDGQSDVSPIDSWENVGVFFGGFDGPRLQSMGIGFEG